MVSVVVARGVWSRGRSGALFNVQQAGERLNPARPRHGRYLRRAQLQRSRMARLLPELLSSFTCQVVSGLVSSGPL